MTSSAQCSLDIHCLIITSIVGAQCELAWWAGGTSISGAVWDLQLPEVCTSHSMGARPPQRQYTRPQSRLEAVCASLVTESNT